MDNLQIQSGIKSPMGDGINQQNIPPPIQLGNYLANPACKSFIYKVYIMLVVQYIVIIGFCFLSIYIQSFAIFQYEFSWLMGIFGAIMLTCQIIIYCVPASRRQPINIIMYVFFTLGFSYMISNTCSLVLFYEGTNAVFLGIVMSLSMLFVIQVILVGLAIYAVFTREGFKTGWGVLIVFCGVIPPFSILFFGIRFALLIPLISSIGAIFFGIYIVIDTQFIIAENRRFKLSTNEFLSGSIIIHIDLIVYLIELICMK